MPADELRVLKRQLWGQERLGDAAGSVHRVETQVPGEVRDEVQAIADELGLDE